VISDEEAHKKSGQESAHTVKHTSLHFSDKAQDIHYILIQIIIHQSQPNSEDGIGYRIKQTPRRQLEGFDFIQIATNGLSFKLEIPTPKTTGRDWLGLIRGINAITLFVRKFSEIMIPESSVCRF
jgi:hypothetical protein